MEQTGNIAAMHEDRKDGHSNGDAPDPRLPGEKDDKQHGIGRGGQNGAERDIVRRKDDDQKPMTKMRQSIMIASAALDRMPLPPRKP